MHRHTMRFESTAIVLAKCKLKSYRISECGIRQKEYLLALFYSMQRPQHTSVTNMTCTCMTD